MNPQVINFFKEIINRIRTKSPRFFFILSVFGASLTFAGYIPSMLQQWFNVDVPGHVIKMCEDIAKYASGFFVASLLPAQNNSVAQTQQGDILKVTDERLMPFTAKSEVKAEAKQEVEIPTAIIVPKN